jgi:hypothetical protein
LITPLASLTDNFAAMGASALLAIGAGWALWMRKQREAEGQDGRSQLIVGTALLFLSMILLLYSAATA